MYQPITGTGTGAAPVVNLTWPYIDQSHVQATVNGSPVSYTWTGASQITFTAAVASGATWAVVRSTPTDTALTDFTDVAVLTANDLNKVATQTLYAFQEAVQKAALATDAWDALTGYPFGTVGRKLQQFKSVDDYESHAVADALGLSGLFVPTEVTSTLASGGAIVTPLWGPEQVTTADGNKRGPLFSRVSARPATLGDSSTIDTAFNGDFSGSLFPIEFRIEGGALGQPTSGYLFTPEVYPLYGVLKNTSGWNNGTADNVGRTGAAFFRIALKQYGQGDLVAYNATGLVTGSRSGATHWLANPAGILVNGDLFAANDGVFLNGREINLTDNGHDVTGIFDVVNFSRTNAAGALSTTWLGSRYQSNGTQPVDAIFSAVGKFRRGLDFTPNTLDFGTDKSAILFKQDQKFYLNASSSNDYYATTVGTDFFGYSSANAGLEFTLGGSVRFRLKSNGNMALPSIPASTSYTDDTAAAAGGVAVGQVYRNGSVLQIRVV